MISWKALHKKARKEAESIAEQHNITAGEVLSAAETLYITEIIGSVLLTRGFKDRLHQYLKEEGGLSREN